MKEPLVLPILSEHSVAWTAKFRLRCLKIKHLIKSAVPAADFVRGLISKHLEQETTAQKSVLTVLDMLAAKLILMAGKFGHRGGCASTRLDWENFT